MLIIILLLLIFLWFAGYGPVESLYVPLFNIGRHVISLWDIIIFGVIAWLIGILPSPFRQIAGVFFVLWILSLLGFLAIAGLSSMLLIAIIVGLVMYTIAY
jgi:hypothetical protein